MKPWQDLPALLRREGALQGRPASIEHCLATSLAHWQEGLPCSTRLACLACVGGPKLALYLGALLLTYPHPPKPLQITECLAAASRTVPSTSETLFLC